MVFMSGDFRVYIHELTSTIEQLDAVGTAITVRPPHRSVHADFPHTAPHVGKVLSDIASLAFVDVQQKGNGGLWISHVASFSAYKHATFSVGVKVVANEIIEKIRI